MSRTNADLDAAIDALRGAADPERAAPMAAYMKDHFDFLGIASPERARVTAPFLNSTRSWPAARLVDTVDLLWQLPEREFRYLGVDLLKRRARVLTAAELPRLEYLIRTDPWWDTVDALAAHPVGTVVARHPDLGAVMDTWIDDDDIWIARTAILHQLRYGDDTNAERLSRYVDRRADDAEFFIRKALGWALREYGKTHPAAVLEIVDRYGDRLSALTRREALKHLA